MWSRFYSNITWVIQCPGECDVCFSPIEKMPWWDKPRTNQGFSFSPNNFYKTERICSLFVFGLGNRYISPVINTNSWMFRLKYISPFLRDSTIGLTKISFQRWSILDLKVFWDFLRDFQSRVTLDLTVACSCNCSFTKIFINFQWDMFDYRQALYTWLL